MAFSIVSTVLSAAANTALADLATAKDELQVQQSSHDTWLARAINRMSIMIANYTNRTLVPELVRDVIDIDRDAYPYQSPGGFRAIPLSRWPVLGVLSVVQTLSATQTLTLVEDVDYRLDAQNGQLIRLNSYTGTGSTWEACPITVIYSSGYGTLVTEAHQVPAVSPWKVTVDKAANFSCDHQLTFNGGLVLTRVTAAPISGQYSVSAGSYTFASTDAGKVVNFAYAVTDIPDDLVDICLRLVVARFRARGRDPMLMQRDTPEVGSERYWVGGTVGQDGPFPPDITAALDTYRVPVLA